MKTIHKISIILSVFMTMMLSNCAKSDKEFVHDSNTISQIVCKASYGTHGNGSSEGTEFRGVIYEYDKNEKLVAKDGKLVTDDGKDATGEEFTQQDVEGGYGRIIFEIPAPYMEIVDLSNIYLVATLDWDQFITPSLTGRHDITGDGIIITVKSGVGTTRQYRIQGSFE